MVAVAGGDRAGRGWAWLLVAASRRAVSPPFRSARAGRGDGRAVAVCPARLAAGQYPSSLSTIPAGGWRWRSGRSSTGSICWWIRWLSRRNCTCERTRTALARQLGEPWRGADVLAPPRPGLGGPVRAARCVAFVTTDERAAADLDRRGGGGTAGAGLASRAAEARTTIGRWQPIIGGVIQGTRLLSRPCLLIQAVIGQHRYTHTDADALAGGGAPRVACSLRHCSPGSRGWTVHCGTP
jgi:hypothetical protein